LMRSAAPRSGRGSRAVRMLMTAVTLGAISVSGVYLVDPESTRTPRSPAGPADKDPALQQGTVPTPREFDANSPRDQSRAPGREIGALSRRPEVVRQTARLEFNEAGFSSLPELTEADIRSSDKASVAEDTTSLTAEGPELLSLDPAEDSASTVVTDSLTEDAGDLYATTALPGATLTQAPQIMRLSRPQLTDISRRSETEEEITVMVEIGADGVPLQARVVQSTYPPYNHAVIDAVMRSDFQAGLTPSGPAAKWMTIPFRIKP